MSPRVTHDMAKGEPVEPLMLLPCPFRPKSLRPGHHCKWRSSTSWSSWPTKLWLELRKQKSSVKICYNSSCAWTWFSQGTTIPTRAWWCASRASVAPMPGDTENPFQNSKYSKRISSARRISLGEDAGHMWGCWESISSKLSQHDGVLFFVEEKIVDFLHDINRSGAP